MTGIGYLKTYYEAISTNEEFSKELKIELYESVINYIIYGMTSKVMSETAKSIFQIMYPNLKPLKEAFLKKNLGKNSEDCLLEPEDEEYPWGGEVRK